MNTAYKEAKKLHDELKKDENNVEAMLKLTEFMASYGDEDKIVWMSDLDAQIKELENEKRYYTGIKKLDDLIDGFRSNQLIAVSAPSKAGKTQFCVHIARNFPNPTMFLFEETAAEVAYKYHKKGLELPRILTLQDFKESSVDYLYRKMIESWAKYDSRIFFIDHLHYLIPDEGTEHITYKIRKVVQELKMFAKRHNFTIFLVAHISHQSFDQPPGIEDIRDSSFIVQYADTTLMLWRETFQPGVKSHKKVYNYTNNLLVNVALNRKINFVKDYNTGLVGLTFNTTTWSYDESDWYDDLISDDSQGSDAKSKILKQLEK